VSVLKTTEEILGLGNLSIGDLLATDMSDFFTPTGGDVAPYDALTVPAQTRAQTARVRPLADGAGHRDRETLLVTLSSSKGDGAW